MKRKYKILLGLVVVFSLLIAVGFLSRAKIQDWISEQQQPQLPPVTSLNNLNLVINQNSYATNDNAEVNTNSTNSKVDEPPLTIPSELNLDIPFTSQAPTANWDAAHEEYCEEASLVMANRFLTSRTIDGPADADQAMSDMAAWEVEQFGYFESTTAEETAVIARDYLGLQAEVLPYSLQAAKEALVQGRMVIIPAAGRELGNPNFTAPGPIYHMLVIKGWTQQYVITNDPGTRKGADYVYDPEVLAAAVGDYNHNDPTNGEKVMIVVWK